MFVMIANINFDARGRERYMNSNKKRTCLGLILLVSSFLCCACTASIENEEILSATNTPIATSYVRPTMKSTNTSARGVTATFFTNKYGTETTKCAHAGCSNYIASSGDTNCCPTHSNRCIGCNCYIDGDALMCLECITSAAYSSK